MRMRSVVAVVDLRDDRGQGFALGSTERGFAHHDRGVEAHAGVERAWVLALDAQDAEDLAGALDGLIVDMAQPAFGFIDRYRVNPGHVFRAFFDGLEMGLDRNGPWSRWLWVCRTMVGPYQDRRNRTYCPIASLIGSRGPEPDRGGKCRAGQGISGGFCT